MRTIIAGSRSVRGYGLVERCVDDCFFVPTTVLSGCASGVDRLGERWAAKNNVPVEWYAADWINEGKSAGYRRNLRMADNAEMLIAVWDGSSPGTKHMIDIATSKGLLVWVYDSQSGKRAR